MPGARARPGTDDHLVPGQVFYQLVDQRENRRPPAIDEALAADLDNIGLGQDLEGRLRVECSEPGLIRQTAAHQRSGQRQNVVVHFVSSK